MAAPMLLAGELATYSDAALDRYLEENGRIVSVQDPQNLPESFIQRLRDRVRSANRSRPVDLDQVSARLLEATSEAQASPERRPWEMRETDCLWGLSEEAVRILELPILKKGAPGGVREERVYHDELLMKGGRPWYPIHLIDSISQNPREYSDLLRAWQEFPDAAEADWEVFAKQYMRWYRFGVWQAKRRHEFDGRISDYTGWAKRLLSKLSFTQSFEFDEKPERQDRLTTWIEYLTYEYNLHRVKYARSERRGAWFDKQWQKVADSGLLRPHETREFILRVDGSLERSLQDSNEEERARRSLESAQAAVSLAQKAASSRPSASASQRLAAAQSKLDSARQSFDAIKKRNDLITEFFVKTERYRQAKRLGERQMILLQWIREQIPLIEAELEKSNAAESSVAPPDRNGDAAEEMETANGLSRGGNTELKAHGGKRGHDSMTDDGEPPPKRPKREVNPKASDRPANASAAAAKSQGSGTVTTVRLQPTDTAEQPVVRQQPLRRSARIAARQSRPAPTTEPPSRVIKGRQQRRRNSAGARGRVSRPKG
ncbi:hypothetical protein VTK26DRAFT_2362 [Humicola hyalothermophila]